MHDERTEQESATTTCRLRKVYCPGCGYIARITRKWIAQGLPVYVCGAQWVAEEDVGPGMLVAPGTIAPMSEPVPTLMDEVVELVAERAVELITQRLRGV